ncbi:MAG: heme lyase CcmF/NrfE family subunit [Deltaproteobacteria bacterium]|nr:heme lyase CcmF/NrfE family subunit [Deltaproteobacteria bacterium]MCB9785461.1 heme lyase CcmF/NrfE family subunit [Deltaproteobacteria bacterium]
MAELGRLLILAALALASAGALVGFSAGRSGSARGLRITRGLALAFAACLVGATGVMEYALITHDFSVEYVAHVGSLATPLHITIVSLWSSLDGSILFWGFILAVYTTGFVLATRGRHEDMQPYTLATIMAVGTFFTFLIAGPANPFGDTPAPIPTDGPGPNALLQNHALMIIHPPMLYMGYVGMTIPFAMGVAALLKGRSGAGWTRPLRRWMLIPWGFLTCGIILGGWWAYEVLGWGGYWAWDPVENASLLPWLTATAFLHAAMLQERRGLLAGWTLVLLLVTFQLTILGTFMTRSGVFNSVHSFTQSPIGPTFLVFLAMVLIASVVLVAANVHRLAPGRPIESPASREAAFIVNNLLFAAFTFTVLVGTTFPLIAEAARGVKVSVGEPFFDQFAVPLGLAIVFLMGVGPAMPWGRATGAEVARRMGPPLLGGLVLAALGVALGVRDVLPALTLLVAGFAVSVTLRDVWDPVRARMTAKGESLGRAFASALRRGRRRFGGQVVHIGVAIAVVAIALSQSYQIIGEGVIDKGATLTVSDYTLQFVDARSVTEPHRERTIATIAVSKGGRDLGTMEPALNNYATEMNAIGSPAVRTSPVEDLYLSVMSIDPRGQSIGLRVFINPAVAWLWIAMGVMVFGCLIAVWPTRRSEASGAVA